MSLVNKVGEKRTLKSFNLKALVASAPVMIVQYQLLIACIVVMCII